MKAGRELDERLCELLEPISSLCWLERPIAPLGFWTWYKGYSQLTDEWQPISVSTDWGAAGEAIDKLAADGQKVEIEVGDYSRARVGNDGAYFVGDTGTHAFALAAGEALEMKDEG